MITALVSSAVDYQDCKLIETFISQLVSRFHFDKVCVLCSQSVFYLIAES